MRSNIVEYISKCDTCLKYSRKQVKEPLIQHDRPNRPSSKVGCDTLTFGGRDYLVLVDYYSN
ncbi:unnamed protein product [Acanthoscelides obtectus]|uniref:Integrase zinc-binding domain-containing protein n=1 Tax=Acanthoscelides obtectus TaxID=200917 RepID=A0A9P0MF09_ACAOB|nr:unnamed protein product [Acanthoscelides obtectus]CAK1635789.1 hypothetical protein AOBTE_LOCUS9505 [Acanthoscelides obtectus]